MVGNDGEGSTCNGSYVYYPTISIGTEDSQWKWQGRFIWIIYVQNFLII